MITKYVKARTQGNAVVVTIPKSFNVTPGTEFKLEMNKEGILTLNPTKVVPDTIEELFAGWHGKYETPADLLDWDNQKRVGKELW